MTAIYVTAYGHGTDVLCAKSLPFSLQDPIPDDSALVEMRFAGINFIDVYYRIGLYKKPAVPFVTCDEGCGIICGLPTACGANQGLSIGTRVAFFRGSSGAAATHALVKLADLHVVPESLSDEDAAAVLLQGATAHYLTRSCYPVAAGDVVLVHAAAGGTGLLIAQICHLLGATVIGTCGGEAKAALAKAVGKADAVIDYKANSDWVNEVKRIAAAYGQGGGVNVVFDGVGKDTFLGGLACLKRRGHMITYGNASGPVDAISPLTLTQHGSITLQRPTLKDYSAEGGEIEGRVQELFQWIAAGKLTLTTSTVFPLAEVACAFEALEGRQTMGKVLLRCHQ